MLINKLKRAEQNIQNLPFLPLEKAQVEFLFSPSEFKAQVIELMPKNAFMSPRFTGKKMKQGKRFWTKFIASNKNTLT